MSGEAEGIGRQMSGALSTRYPYSYSYSTRTGTITIYLLARERKKKERKKKKKVETSTKGSVLCGVMHKSPSGADDLLSCLSDDAIGHIALFMSAETILGSFVAVNKAIRQVVKKGREERGWNKVIRKNLMDKFKRGVKLWNGHGESQLDIDGGRELIRMAASWGLRQARAWLLRHSEVIMTAARKERYLTLLTQEYESKQSARSGGVCGWTVGELGRAHIRGDFCARTHQGIVCRSSSACDKGIALLHEAADKHDETAAAWELALTYRWGFARQAADESIALKYYQVAAHGGSTSAARSLADFYMYGRLGLAVNLNCAEHFYRIALKSSNCVRTRGNIELCLVRVGVALQAQADARSAHDDSVRLPSRLD